MDWEDSQKAGRRSSSRGGWKEEHRVKGEEEAKEMNGSSNPNSFIQLDHLFIKHLLCTDTLKYHKCYMVVSGNSNSQFRVCG